MGEDMKEIIMEELLQGKTMANQLQVLLRDPGIPGSDLAHDLVAKILGSFTESLSVLSSRHPPPKCDCSGSEDGNKKRSAGFKDKRGCYKRRKSCQTRTTVASTIEDDHAWRKYGQKAIHNSKYPRSYFRCSHKYDQNCKAVKQVQKMEDNPHMYEITYIDVHTCTDSRKAPLPQMNKDSAQLWDLDALSGSNPLDIKEDLLFNSSSAGAAALGVKEEAKSEITDIEFDSLLMEAGDLPEGSSKYQGFGMDFLMNDDSGDLSRFGY